MPPAGIRLLALFLLLGVAAWAQEQTPPEPPEEDESLIPKEYSFNPIQARKEVQIGNYYFKRGSYRAATGRFREAVKWDPNCTEAYRRLGEAAEKLKEPEAARKAYEKYLELEKDARRAEEVRKRLSRKK